MSKNYLSQSNEDLEVAVKGSLNAVSELLGDDSSDFSRFKNVQNRIYLKLLEHSSTKKQRNSLLMGTSQE